MKIVALSTTYGKKRMLNILRTSFDAGNLYIFLYAKDFKKGNVGDGYVFLVCTNETTYLVVRRFAHETSNGMPAYIVWQGHYDEILECLATTPEANYAHGALIHLAKHSPCGTDVNSLKDALAFFVPDALIEFIFTRINPTYKRRGVFQEKHPAQLRLF